MHFQIELYRKTLQIMNLKCSNLFKWLKLAKLTCSNFSCFTIFPISKMNSSKAKQSKWGIIKISCCWWESLYISLYRAFGKLPTRKLSSQLIEQSSHFSEGYLSKYLFLSIPRHRNCALLHNSPNTSRWKRNLVLHKDVVMFTLRLRRIL